MFGNLTISGGPTGLSYNLQSPSSKVQLERGWRVPTSQRTSSLVARDPFAEVLEVLPLQIIGTTEADVWTQYDAFVYFAQAIAQARQKPDYDIYKFSMQNMAAATTWETMILGPAPNTPVISPPTKPIDHAAGMYRMPGVTLTFMRKGRLINPASTVTSSTDTTQLADGTYEMTFAQEQAVDSPLKLVMTAAPNNAKAALAEGMLLISNHPVTVAENSWRFGSLISGTNWTNINDSAFLPNTSGSLVSRFLATNNNAVTSNDAVFSPIISWKRMLILATAMNLTAGAGLIMRLNFKSPDGNEIRTETQPIIGDGSAHVISLGVIAGPPNGIGFFNVTTQNTTAALSDVRIERIICVNLDNPHVMMFRHGQLASGGSYTLDPRYLTDLNPIFSGLNGANVLMPRYVRGPQHMSQQKLGVRVLWLKPDGRYWDWRYTVGGARVTWSMQCSVNPAALAPR